MQAHLNLSNILHNYTKEYSFYAVGNRSEGGFSNNTDLSILIKGNNHKVFEEDLNNIKKSVEHTHLPFKVHLINNSKLNKRSYLYIKNNMTFIPL